MVIRMQRVGEWEGEEEECDFSCLQTIHQDQLYLVIPCYFTSFVVIRKQRVGEGEGEE